MNVYRILKFEGLDPLPRLHSFLADWWEHTGIEAMLAPGEFGEAGSLAIGEVHEPSGLLKVNPFAPLMTSNAAAQAADFLQNNPRGRRVIMLRPCELRTVQELQKRGRLRFPPAANGGRQTVILFGVDCGGTFSELEYARRAARLGRQQLTWESLMYRLTEAYSPNEMREACQLCDWPAPCHADLCLGTLGVAHHQYLLMIARDEITDAQLCLAEVTDRPATEAEVIPRETGIGFIADQNALHRSRLDAHQEEQSADMWGFMAHLTHCTLCADCLDACPLYEGELAEVLGVGGSLANKRPLLSEMAAVARWLVSCSGCGMCQEACENNVPLTSLITQISHRARGQLSYRCGEPSQPLPWKVG